MWFLRTSKLHEVEATHLQFWFYGISETSDIKSRTIIKYQKTKKTHNQCIEFIKKGNKTTRITECVSYSQTCRQEYQSVIFHKTEEEIKYSFPCVSILWVSLSLSLWWVFLCLRWCFFTSSSWNEWTLLQLCGKLAAKLYIQLRQPWAFTNALCTSFPHPLTVKKKKINPKALTC